MIKKIVLVPGLNRKFDSFTFKIIEDWSIKNNIPLVRLLFTKYKNDEKFSSTFREQVEELDDSLGDFGDSQIIVAKSLGCIPALLSKTKSKKILISPPIVIGEIDEEIIKTDFSQIPTKPISISEEMFDGATVIFSKEDTRILPEEINKLKNCELYLLEGSEHDPSSEELKLNLITTLEKYAKKN